MPKPITCRSRDARAYLSSGALSKHERTDPHDLLCKRYEEILEDAETWLNSESAPVFVSSRVSWGDHRTGMCVGCDFWLYKNRIYDEADDLDFTIEQRKLLIFEEFDKERIQFERLEAKFSGMPTSSQSRSKIPSHVRIFVWQRDGGRCVECNSNENLEYDHIIPFAKGGSNTERNLQLLCGNCNRLKSDKIQ